MKRFFPLLLLLLLGVLLQGCQKENGCFVGDENAEPEIETVFLDAAGEMQPMKEGDQVPLILPPQGGKVLLVAVRAKNLDGCPITISTSLRDIYDQAIVANEIRELTLEQSADGWLEPPRLRNDTLLGVGGYSNLPACPRANISRNVNDEPYLLTIRVEDREGRKAERMLEIIPTCAQPEYEGQCTCECRFDYTQGGCGDTSTDAGTSTTSDAG